MNYVASFSGGKDSTAMLLLIKEQELPLDEIIYADVGYWMWDNINDHIKAVEDYLEMPVTKIDISDQIQKAFNKNGFPSFFVRWCTGLKRDNINKYLSKYKPSKLVNYIGFAYDEIKRAEKKHRTRGNVQYPLIDYNITEADALQMCYDAGFDFGGIYEHHSRLNCWMCPLQRIGELKYVFINYPDKWELLRDLQYKSRLKFRSDYSVFELEHKFWKELISKNNVTK